MAKNDTTNGAQTNPRQTGGEPPAPPAATPASASTGTTELPIPKLGDKPPADTQGTAGAAPDKPTNPDKPTADPAGPITREEVVNIANNAAINAAGMAADLAIERMMARMAEARNNPVMGRETYDAEVLARVNDLDIGADQNLDTLKRSDLDIARADPLAFESHAAELKFTMEPVTILVHDTADPNEQQIIGPIGINGRQIYVERGKEVTLPRCYVEQLFRARTHRKKTKVVRNDDGDVFNRISTSSALAYPFTIVRDANPRGRAWRNKLSREG